LCFEIGETQPACGGYGLGPELIKTGLKQTLVTSVARSQNPAIPTDAVRDGCSKVEIHSALMAAEGYAATSLPARLRNRLCEAAKRFARLA
jgi:hypothetical protein